MKTKSTIKAKIKFYNWAKNRGVDLKNFDPEKINFDGKSQTSSFKDKPDEVKRLHNYKFANLHDDNLENYPYIERLIFERKN